MTYAVKYHPLVVKQDIPALDETWRERIKTAIEQKLIPAPDLFGIPLRRSLKGHRKLRVGDYRIVFRLEKKTVVILAILHRSNVYQQVAGRV